MTDDELTHLGKAVGEALETQNATVATAESCTAGWVAKVLTDAKGSSCWFEFGFVTYSNKAKESMLGVSPATLEQYGAVSEQVVSEMAHGALKASDANYAISISGIAGPDGGSIEKPVGTVWFGFAHGTEQPFVIRQLFDGSRDDIRRKSVAFALQTFFDRFLKINA